MELRQRLLLSGALWLAATVSAAAEFDNLGKLAAQGARISAAVWDLDADALLTQLQSTQRLTPASLSKIVIAAAVLETWAPDKTFPTETLASTAPRNGMLRGDLILRGSGDATLDETTLWALAAQIRSMGLTRVEGRGSSWSARRSANWSATSSIAAMRSGALRAPTTPHPARWA